MTRNQEYNLKKVIKKVQIVLSSSCISLLLLVCLGLLIIRFKVKVGSFKAHFFLKIFFFFFKMHACMRTYTDST